MGYIVLQVGIKKSRLNFLNFSQGAFLNRTVVVDFFPPLRKVTFVCQLRICIMRAWNFIYEPCH